MAHKTLRDALEIMTADALKQMLDIFDFKKKPSKKADIIDQFLIRCEWE